MSTAPDPGFTHLRVASGYSLRHGACLPDRLVEVAAAAGMNALALTDRDGLYGAVKFARACAQAGLSPLLGVDLAVEPTNLGSATGSVAGSSRPSQGRESGGPGRRSPALGGASVENGYPRVVVLALGADPERGRAAGQGWAQLCRLVTATHLRGERGKPQATSELIAQHAQSPGHDTAMLAVLLGPDSDVGRAVQARRTDLAFQRLRRWRAALPANALAVEIVCHDGPPESSTGLPNAARLLRVAREAGIPAVLSNAVRYATPDGAMVTDVLDAVRRLVPLSSRHVDRTTAQGYLAAPVQMHRIAARVAAAAGEHDDGRRLLADTAALARRAQLVPATDLGIGTVHLPEPHILGLGPQEDPLAVLRKRCDAAINHRYPQANGSLLRRVEQRLAEELATIETLGFAAYFLTIADVCSDIRGIGVRVAARGSGAGSMVNHLLGVSGVEPLSQNLLMERFLSPLRAQLPDVDLDVESARRDEVYAAILDRFGAARVAAVSMMDTYRVRNAVRDVGAALGMNPADVAEIATAFPHIRARDARTALAELPELRARGLGAAQLDLFFELVESLDALPRHIMLHPCGVLISDAGLHDRTPVEASWEGLPMSQFDKDDVEEIGLLKLDVLGIRMQSAMAHAVSEVARVEGTSIELDAVPLDDELTFRMIRTAHTLGCFQIESPGQRELIGRFGPETFTDLAIDISLFRPGPVKSDMISPFLRARHGWEPVMSLHASLDAVLAETSGVVVFHEQILQLVAIVTGCSLAQADEVRRAMGSPIGKDQIRDWFGPAARRNGYTEMDVQRIWRVLESFASFGFCRAHAVAFALPTYQSAWLKRHHPAAFIAGLLTHDPGMYPKRLILDDARNLGIVVLPLDINASDEVYRVEPVPVAEADVEIPHPGTDLPDGRGWGIRMSLADVKGISQAEIARIIASRPYVDLADLWHRAAVKRPVVEHLILAGGLDSLYGLNAALPFARRGRITRRDLLLQITDLDRASRSSRSPRSRARSGALNRRDDRSGWLTSDPVRAAAAEQSRSAAPAPAPVDHAVQLTLDLGDNPDTARPSGLPELTGAERTRAELEILGMDAGRHVLDYYTPMLEALGITRSRNLIQLRSRSEVLVAGVKVATQTPPVRSGRRVVFLTLDDATGPVDATFFEDVQGPYAATVFHSWLLVVHGVVRRTGRRGLSLRATGAWELTSLWQAWSSGGVGAVRDLMRRAESTDADRRRNVVSGRSAEEGPVPIRPPAAMLGAGGFISTPEQEREAAAATEASTGLPTGDRRDAPQRTRGRSGGMSGGNTSALRRVLVHPATGYEQSPYADLRPAGEDPRQVRGLAAHHVTGLPNPEPGDQDSVPTDPPSRAEPPVPSRKVWHSSPGSSGR